MSVFLDVKNRESAPAWSIIHYYLWKLFNTLYCYLSLLFFLFFSSWLFFFLFLKMFLLPVFFTLTLFFLYMDTRLSNLKKFYIAS